MNFLLGSSVPLWVEQSFPIIQIVLVSIMALAAIVMIISILAQEPQTNQGPNAITGGHQSSDSYYSRNKGANTEGKLRRLTIICASIIAFCAILYFVTYIFFQGSL